MPTLGSLIVTTQDLSECDQLTLSVYDAVSLRAKHGYTMAAIEKALAGPLSDAKFDSQRHASFVKERARWADNLRGQDKGDAECRQRFLFDPGEEIFGRFKLGHGRRILKAYALRDHVLEVVKQIKRNRDAVNHAADKTDRALRKLLPYLVGRTTLPEANAAFYEDHPAPVKT